MAEYIERQKVIDMLENAYLVSDGYGEYCGYCTDDIEIETIPAADVVPVVRCKECKYSYKSWLSDILRGTWCTFWQKTQGKAWTMMHFDDFCSHGTKKDLEESK